MKHIKNGDTAFLDYKWPISKVLKNPTTYSPGVCWTLILLDKLLTQQTKTNNLLAQIMNEMEYNPKEKTIEIGEESD